MAGLSGRIMELFGRNAAGDMQQQQMQPTQAQSASVTANSTIPSEATPKSDGSAAAFPKAGEGSKSPLEGYKDLWEVSDKDGKLDSPVPQMTIDSKKLSEATKDMDFLGFVDKSLIAKATSGDQAAMMDVINAVGQAGLSQATAIATAITRDAVTQLTANNKTYLDETLRRNRIGSELREENLFFEDPAAKPLLTMLETRFAEKYPQASAQEVANHAKEYLTGFIKAGAKSQGFDVVDPATAPKTPGSKRPETDWEKLLS
jgi:hypothetical protein